MFTEKVWRGKQRGPRAEPRRTANTYGPTEEAELEKEVGNCIRSTVGK